METQENLIKQLSDQKYALDQAAIVAATDVNGVITYVNDKFCKISGYERDELIGRTHAIVNSKTHPPEFFAELWSTIKSGQVWQGEVCNRNKIGELYWVSTTIVPFCDQNNKPIQFMSIRYEITDLKKAQEVIQDQQVKLASASRLSAMGELAAAITHEINNPLGVILGRVEMLKSMLQDEKIDREDLYKKIESIEVTGLRIEKIIRGMKSLAHHREDEAPQKHILKLVLNEAIDLVLYRLERKGIQFSFDCGSDEWKVLVRSHQLVQVVVNLLNNAIDAISHNTERWIKITTTLNGKQLIVEVSDSGKGIPDSVVAKMFNPFFSTKSVQYGTGLGLSISVSLIQKNMGNLEYLRDRMNTTFRITLPLA